MTEKVERKRRIPRVLQETTQVENSGLSEGENFNYVETSIPGLVLLVDKGINPPNISTIVLQAIHNAITPYAERAETIDQLTEAQKEPREFLVQLPDLYEGFRGAKDTVSGREVQINPDTKDVFDMTLLRDSLGPDFQKYVHDITQISINLPSSIDPVKFEASLKRMLKRRGQTDEQTKKSVDRKTTQRVDTTPLARDIKKRKVTIKDGAWEKEVTVWKAVPRRVTSQSEIEEAQEAVITTSQSPQE